ncbi:hypothetical protein LEP1GSC058_3264 [Leptospira fainei serovar Hurstbridge str. BUT 6]|uniref:Uncharacterized protein n=1 Tax=Leptospira fainei serovar Hurstbridge str. BUT 6 TaxID=1193011 RepID=S3VCH2_9LEPT|nr:hypothetical protein [Leptospira fainei]EPG74165.1 hypothetical protein LEP1GSC058_3264 [Leptospira fainei serovar Hurstbridge str. BUT 6]
MKIPFRIFSILLSFVFCFNCATYWSQRKNDLQDVFTAGIENPGYGLGVRIGPLAAGFVFQGGETEPGKKNLGAGYGIRGGSIGSYRSQQLIFGILGSDKFHALPKGVKAAAPVPKAPDVEVQPTEDSSANPVLLFPELPEEENDNTENSEIDNLDERQKAKSFDIRYLKFYNIPVEERRKQKKEAFFRKYIENLDPNKKNEALQNFLMENPLNKDDYPKAFLFQLELYIGARYGIRIGFNLAELLDFLIGFTGLDILEDDI